MWGVAKIFFAFAMLEFCEMVTVLRKGQRETARKRNGCLQMGESGRT